MLSGIWPESGHASEIRPDTGHLHARRSL